MSLHIIHTADWHLGQTFYGFDREVEHDAFLLWLTETLQAQKADVLLISGDVFDVANPSAAAQRRFFRFLRDTHTCLPSLQIIIVAGNHDSAARLEAPLPLLEEWNTHIVGVVRRDETGIDMDALLVPLCNAEGQKEALCLAIPYLRQGDYPVPDELPDSYVDGITRMYSALYVHAGENNPEQLPVIAMGHLHVSGAQLNENDRSERVLSGGLESVAGDSFPAGLAYVALGHLHKAQKIGSRDEIRYAGSPIPMSFSETNYKHQVVSVKLEEKVTTISALPIPRLIDLLRIPRKPLKPDDVLLAISELPDKEDENISLWPYLEVQVLLEEPEPGFRHRVEEAIQNKAVRLTSIIPYYPTEKNEVGALTFDDLQKIDPLDLLKRTFWSKYGDELPEELEKLFAEVTREVEL